MNEFDKLLNRFAASLPVKAKAKAKAKAAADAVGDSPPQDADGSVPEAEHDEIVATPEATLDATSATANPQSAAADDDSTQPSENVAAASEDTGESLQDQQLRAFQERLSERLGKAGAARQTKLGVEAGGRLWLVELSEAGEIVAVPPNFAVVPLTHSWLRGLVNLRGSLHAVTDLADFLGEPPSVVGRESRLLVFASRLNLNSAVLVDRMIGLQDMAGLRMISDPDGADAAEWVDSQDRHWYELSLQQLAVDERFLVAAR
jgi:twitching motility protein PilI